MDMSPQEYQQYVQSKAKKSPIVKDVVLAFLIGGAICVIGQAVQNRLERGGAEQGGRGHRHLLHHGVFVGAFDGAEPLQQAGPLRRSGHPGAHHRLCKRCGLSRH